MDGLRNVVEKPSFEAFIMATIGVNTVLLAIARPNVDPSPAEVALDSLCTIIFFVEFLLKYAALGAREYFSDNWNRLDFVVVLESIITFVLDLIPGLSGALFSAKTLRLLRLLRPLRTLRFIPGMKTLIETVIGAAQHTFSILLVIFMLLFLCSAFAYVYWARMLDYRCLDISTGAFNTPSSTGRFITLDSMLCFGGNPGDDARQGCDEERGLVCAKYDHQPQDDTILFDDIWNSFVSSFRVILRDNWMLSMWYIQDGVQKGTWLPFFVLFFVGTFALVNLFPGAMMTSLQAQVRAEANALKREKDLAANDADDDDGGGAGAAVRTDFELLLENFEEAYQDDLKHVNEVLAGREVAVEEEEEGAEGKEEPRCTPACLPVCKDVRHFVEQPFGFFAQGIYLVIFLMVLTLALDSYNASPQETKVYAALNIVFNVIFLLEMVVKMGSLGPFKYFDDKFNSLDFSLVVIGFLDLAVEAALSGTKALRVVRVFRLARVARLASLSKVVKLTNPTPSIDLLRMVEILSDSGWFISNVFFLLLFFNFLFTLSGMQLFGGKAVFDGQAERFNFDSFNNAFMTTFSMTTGSTGFVIFKQISFTLRSNFAFAFYIAWQVLSKYMLLSTVAATLFQRIEDDAVAHMKKMARVTMRSCYLFDRSMMRAWRAMAFRKWRDMMFRASGRAVTGAFVHVKEDTQGLVTAPKGLVADLMDSPHSYGLFTHRSGVRGACAEVANHWAFELLNVGMILVACVSMCLHAEEDSGARVLTAQQQAQLTAINVTVLVFFLFDFAVKTVYMGVWVAPTSYLRSSWLNKLDAAATFCSFISLVSGSSGFGYLQLLRVARCLTPWRLVNRFKPVSRVLVAVSESWASVGHVATVILATWVLFALVGMQLFGGYFGHCSDPAYPAGAHRNKATDAFPEGCKGTYEDTLSGALVPREWTKPYLNFDDFFSSIYCTLTIFSLDGWDRIYFAAIDGVDPDVNPIVNYNKAYAAYFIVIILISFVMLQMIVGAMYGAFMYLNSTAGGGRIASLKSAFWQIYSTKLRYVEPYSDPARPGEGWRLEYYLLVKSRGYAQTIIACTVLSVTGRFLVWGSSGPFYTAPDWVRVLDFIFAVGFFLEWLVRFGAFSRRGVIQNWYDKVDTFVTIVVLLYAFLDILDMQEGLEVWPRLGFQLHSALCACVSLRLLRLITYVPETHACLVVVRKSMSTLLAMACLTTIITLAYAIVGVTLFGKYSDDFEVDTDASLLTREIYDPDHSNFKKVLPAMQLLYYMGTGADFAGVMQQATANTPNSVSWLVPVYLLSYLILIKYVIFSVCVLVVVFKFTLHATDVNGLAMEAVNDFRANWQQRDPFATGDMPMSEFPNFVRSLKKPLGVDPSASHLEVDRYIKKTLMFMGFAAADIVGPTEELPYTVKFKKALIAMHYLVIFGDALGGDDAEYFKRRVVARNRIRQFKYGVAAQIVKMRESAGGANSETSTGVKDLSVLRSLMPRVFEQRVLKSVMHEVYRLRVQIQFKGFTKSADKEADVLLKLLREEYEAAALQNQRLKLEIEAVVDKFRLEMAQTRNFRYLSLLRQLVRQVVEEREKHLMRTWRLDSMQLHSKFRVRDPVTQVCVSESGEFLFTASSSKVHAWRMKKPSAPSSAPLYALCWGAKQSANVLSMTCTADAKRFFSGHDDHCIRSWQEDARGKGRKVKHSGKFILLLQMQGHEGPVYDLHMYEGYLLSCGGDSTVRFWRARSEETLQSASLASNTDLSTAMGMQVPGVSGTGCFCMSLFHPILDMNKFTEKDVVTQLLVGTSDGQVAAFVLQTDNAFLYTQEWAVSAAVSVGDSKEQQGGAGSEAAGESAFAAIGEVFSGGGASGGSGSGGAAVTSVVCPNRFGDTWELCFAGTSAGEIKIFEFLWKDPLAGSKKAVSGFKPLWQHNVHSGPVSCLTPAGGWLFSASHDMSVVAWREPTLHAGGGVAQGHEDGYVAHQGRVTSMCATAEMIYSVDDTGILLVRNSREKNEVKFIDGEGARVVSRLSDTAKARVVNELKSAYTARRSFASSLSEFTRTASDEYADLLVPDVWMDTVNPETFFLSPKFLEPSLADDALTHFTFLGQLCRHYFPKRDLDKEIPLEVKRFVETRRLMATKASVKSDANMLTSTEQLLAAQRKQTAKDKEEEEEAAMRADPTALVNSNKNATDAEGASVVSVDLNGWVVQMPLPREKTGRWLVAEACRAYHAQKGEGIDANQLVPKDSMVEVPLDLPLGQVGNLVKPGTQLVAMFSGAAPKAYRVGTLSIDLPFRKIGEENSDARRQWEAQYKKELAEVLGGVKPSRIQILSLTPGSIVVSFKIYEEPGNPHAKSPTDCFRDLQAAVESGDAQIAGGDVPPGKFTDNTREFASARDKEDGGMFGFVGEWLNGLGAMTASGGGGGNDDDSSDEDSEEESEYSDESEEDGDGFDDDPAALNPMANQDDVDDDASSLALSVAERGKKNKQSKGKGRKGNDAEEARKKEEAQRKGTLLSWMGLSSAAGDGAGDGGGAVVSQQTVASGLTYDDDGFGDDEEDEDYDDDDEEDPMGYEGVEATEMVDLGAMDSRMESLSAWASAKQKEKKGGVLGQQPAVPKENMKQWVAAKSQGSGGGGGGGGESQSLREWLLFDVALDHGATEEIEAKLRDAGFDSLGALTSSYAVITDRTLKDMCVRKMGHRAQLLTHLDTLRGKVGTGSRPQASASASGGGGILSSMASGVFSPQEYGLATRLQQMEAERELERQDRERQLREIAELKDVVLSALQDPEKRAIVQGQHAGGGGRVGKLLGVLGGGAGGGAKPLAEEVDDAAEYDDDDDNSVYSGESDAASSALGGSVGDAAEDIYARQNMSPEEAARSGREVAAGRVFGVDLGKTTLRGRRDGIETSNATVKSYKHPYFTVVYDGSGEAEYLTLGEVQGLIEQGARQQSLDAAAANQQEIASSDSEEDSGDE